MAVAGIGGEFRMELAGQEPGVTRQFDHLHQIAVGGTAADGQSLALQVVEIAVVELIAVAVAFGNRGLAVGLMGQGVGLDAAGLGAQAHAAAQVGVLVAAFHMAVFGDPFGDQADDRMGRACIEFSGMRPFQPGHIAGEFDHRHLHAQTNPQIGNPVAAGIPGRLNLALRTAVAEAAGDEDGVHPVQGTHPLGLQFLGVDIINMDLAMRFHARMEQGLVQGFVGLGQIHVLAHHGDVDFPLGVFDGLHHRFPFAQIGGGRVDAQFLDDDFVQPLRMQQQRNLVDGTGVHGGDHRPLFHIGE